MANIAITSTCNRKCSYCFAGDSINENNNSPAFMSEELYKKAVDASVLAGIDGIRIIGGEPTLHPQFVNFIKIALKATNKVFLFTNGVMLESIASNLSELLSEQITMIVNISKLESYSVNQRKLLTNFLHCCSDKIQSGFNIYKKGMSLDFLIKYILQYNLRKKIRLGISHPTSNFSNSFLLPKHYFEVGDDIVNFTEKALEYDIKISLDCGFVPCMFQKNNIASANLKKQLVKKQCSPILDILTDGTIISCYPLSDINNVNLNDNNNLNSIVENYKGQLSEHDEMGIFKECSLCSKMISHFCAGGCISQKRHRLNIPFNLIGR